jgi:hypothetical protein
MHISDHGKWDDPEEVLFILKCPHCNKNNAYWAYGSRWEHRKTNCPKCQAVKDKKDTKRGLVITATYTFTTCSDGYKDMPRYSVATALELAFFKVIKLR